MDISIYVASASSYDKLSTHQISQFFKRHGSITQKDCNALAANILKSTTVSPTPVQGANSYTVVAATDQPPQVVQFRDSELDTELINNARQSYRGFVPNYETCGMFGEVYVYVMDIIPGTAFCRVRKQLLAPDMVQSLTRTVQDFASFFASAWINDRPTVKPSLELPSQYLNIIDLLSKSLPERFQRKLCEVRQGLPLLFRPKYPMVVNHDDRVENNIHVDERTGRITGIADWPDAKIAPFGVSLGALETILSVQTKSMWLFHFRHTELRRQFWDTFYSKIGKISEEDQRAIEVALLFGLFQAHGFNSQKPGYVPLKDGDKELMYLEVLFLKLD